MPVSAGRCENKSAVASNPPAEAPIPTSAEGNPAKSDSITGEKGEFRAEAERQLYGCLLRKDTPLPCVKKAAANRKVSSGPEVLGIRDTAAVTLSGLQNRIPAEAEGGAT